MNPGEFWALGPSHCQLCHPAFAIPMRRPSGIGDNTIAHPLPIGRQMGIQGILDRHRLTLASRLSQSGWGMTESHARPTTEMPLMS